QLIIAEGNIASERVAQKCGFTYEGTARQAMFARGRHSDMKIYSLLRPEVETCLPSRLFSSGATRDEKLMVSSQSGPLSPVTTFETQCRNRAMIHRIHILGAFGSGTTTLGRALAACLQCPHFDTDDYVWLPTDPPYTHQRARTERQQLLMNDITAHDAWVVSGSLCGWGDVAIPRFELV